LNKHFFSPLFLHLHVTSSGLGITAKSVIQRICTACSTAFVPYKPAKMQGLGVRQIEPFSMINYIWGK